MGDRLIADCEGDEVDHIYRIHGAEMSPYSVKVRSYFRYKCIPHRWTVRNAETEADYKKHAKIPIIPLVVTPDGTALQDLTPIIEHIEALHPEPSIHPRDTVAAFVSALLEEFGDEWGNAALCSTVQAGIERQCRCPRSNFGH